MDTHPNNNIDLQSTLSHGNNKQQHHNLFSDNTRPLSLDAKASDILLVMVLVTSKMMRISCLEKILILCFKCQWRFIE